MFGYHCYLIWAGMTTSESGKWAALAEDAAQGRVWVAERRGLERRWTGWDGRVLGEQTLGGDGEGEGMVEGAKQGQEETEEAGKDWPISSDQVVVRTADGQPPILPGHRRHAEEPRDAASGEGEWRQVWHLSQVVNLYDLSWWDNWMDVLFPP